jgi:hypothetical protein
LIYSFDDFCFISSQRLSFAGTGLSFLRCNNALFSL